MLADMKQDLRKKTSLIPQALDVFIVFFGRKCPCSWMSLHLCIKKNNYNIHHYSLHRINVCISLIHVVFMYLALYCMKNTV